MAPSHPVPPKASSHVRALRPIPYGSQSRWRAVLREPKWEPTVIGVSCREHVSESQLPGKAGSPLLRAVTFTANI
jgi:hypothetical protein